MYDGFISYSHAADDLLAPRLQQALQRFAKPWWKRRALRVFRDESSLSANPHLWSSITEALGSSEWFVLLLSPDAAVSPWVNQEIEYWKTYKEPSRILPVLTDGSFDWDGSDVTGTAVPEELSGVFEEEPRWVDLRFARDEEDLDLKDPRFADAVADIASALRDVPKDELASEEVRQHRRTIRTAWGAATLVGLLAVAATLFAIQASSERERAERETVRAEQERQRAETEATRANDEAVRAEREAQIARSRELAAAAVAVLDTDPELAVLLAVQSVSAAPDGQSVSPEALRSLREGLLSNRLVARFDDIGDFARVSPDGTVVYAGDQTTGSAVALDVSTGAVVWSSDPLGGDLGRVEVSPDGSIVTIQSHLPEKQTVSVFDASNGDQIARFEPGDGCSGIGYEGLSEIGGFSPGGEWFSVFTGRPNCGFEPGEGWIAVYDTEVWEERHRLNTDDGMAVSARFSVDGSRVLLSTSNADLSFLAELKTFPEAELVHSYSEARTPMALSPDGERVAYVDNRRGPILAEAETGQVIATLGHAAEVFFEAEPFVFSADGSKILVATGTQDLLFDGFTGQFLGTLGKTGSTTSASFTGDGNRALTVTDEAALIWNLATGTAIAGEGFEGNWVNPEQGTDGPRLAVNVIDFEGIFQRLVILDPDSGDIIAERGSWGAAQLGDGRFVLVPIEDSDEGYQVAPLELWDPTDSSRELLAGCSAPEAEIEDDFQFTCPTGQPFFGGAALGDNSPVVTNPEGSAFAAQSSDSPSQIIVWDVESLDRVSEFTVSDQEALVGMTDQWLITRQGATSPLEFDQLHVYSLLGEQLRSIPADRGRTFDGSVEFVADDSLMLTRTLSGLVYAYDTSDWERAAGWSAHQGQIRGWSVSANDEHLATAGAEGLVHVWDISTLNQDIPPAAPQASFPTNRRPSDVTWTTADRLAVFLIDLGASARWFIAFLDTDDLVAESKSRMLRTFTDQECAEYRIDPCPTLEEMRGQ